MRCTCNSPAFSFFFLHLGVNSCPSICIKLCQSWHTSCLPADVPLFPTLSVFLFVKLRHSALPSEFIVQTLLASFFNIQCTSYFKFSKSCSYNILHLLNLFFFDLLMRAARVAISKTSRTPSLTFAEHSRYLWALILSAIWWPSSCVTGLCFVRRSSILVDSSLRRSFLLPTRITGTFGQKCLTWMEEKEKQRKINIILMILVNSDYCIDICLIFFTYYYHYDTSIWHLEQCNQ